PPTGTSSSGQCAARPRRRTSTSPLARSATSPGCRRRRPPRSSPSPAPPAGSPTPPRSTPRPTSASAPGPPPAMTARVPALTRSALLVSDPARDDGHGGGEAGQLIIGAGERVGPVGDQVGRRAGHEGASGLAAEEPRSRDGVEAQRLVPADRVLRAKDAGRRGARGDAADRA